MTPTRRRPAPHSPSQPKSVSQDPKAKKARRSAPVASDPADWETIPMFEMKAAGDGTDKAGSRSAKAVAFAHCPHHRSERKTGLLRSSTHLVWREHMVKTWAGTSIPCRASSVALCVARDTESKQFCDCERGVRWRP